MLKIFPLFHMRREVEKLSRSDSYSASSNYAPYQSHYPLLSSGDYPPSCLRIYPGLPVIFEQGWKRSPEQCTYIAVIIFSTAIDYFLVGRLFLLMNR